ncbi:MAG: hypothetical protein LBM77_11365, partial [Spirochaetaceae bacterium]|nr:hypothetical protein [Spirochaetaceae bacterium]
MLELLKKNDTGEINYNEQPRNVRMRPYAIILPGMIILIGVLIPFVFAIYLSLTNASFRLAMDRWKWNWFANWFGIRSTEGGGFRIVGILGDKGFYHAVYITLVYGISSTLVELLLGMGIAFLLKKDTRYARVLKVVLMFPLMIAPAVAVLIW